MINPTSDPDENLQALRDRILSDPILGAMFRYAPMFVGILDSNRRFLALNDEFFQSIGMSDLDSFVGLRPGAVLRCIHSHDVPEGCGAGDACRLCGAVQTVVRAQRTGSKQSGQARLTTERDGSLIAWDLDIQAEPIRFEGTQIVLLFMRDISSERRRQMLERIFFHDVLNSAGSVKSAVDILHPFDDCEPGSIEAVLSFLAEDVVEQITFHRSLSLAERGELEPAISQVDCRKEVETLVTWEGWQAGSGPRSISFDFRADEAIAQTDRTLFRRVVLNMLRNAREASSNGQIVTVTVSRNRDQVEVAVHNEAVMERDVQLQVFQRSFSTKASGRGFGTYSMRYLTRSFLGGDVDFESTEGAGTTFTLTIPAWGPKGFAQREESGDGRSGKTGEPLATRA